MIFEVSAFALETLIAGVKRHTVARYTKLDDAVNYVLQRYGRYDPVTQKWHSLHLDDKFATTYSITSAWLTSRNSRATDGDQRAKEPGFSIDVPCSCGTQAKHTRYQIDVYPEGDFAGYAPLAKLALIGGRFYDIDKCILLQLRRGLGEIGPHWCLLDWMDDPKPLLDAPVYYSNFAHRDQLDCVSQDTRESDIMTSIRERDKMLGPGLTSEWGKQCVAFNNSPKLQTFRQEWQKLILNAMALAVVELDAMQARDQLPAR